MQHMTLGQKIFFEQNKNKDDIILPWLAWGTCGYVGMIHIDTAKEFFSPSINGVRMGPGKETAEEALKEAERLREGLRERFPKPLERGAAATNGKLLDDLCGENSPTFMLGEIIHLGGLLANVGGGVREMESFSEPFGEFVGDIMGDEKPFGEEMKRIKKVFPSEELSLCEEEDLLDEAVSRLADIGAFGFLCKVCCPIKHYKKCGKICAYSWGHYRTKWIYSETFEQMCQRATAWVKKMDEEDKAKAKEGSINEEKNCDSK